MFYTRGENHVEIIRYSLVPPCSPNHTVRFRCVNEVHLQLPRKPKSVAKKYCSCAILVYLTALQSFIERVFFLTLYSRLPTALTL